MHLKVNEFMTLFKGDNTAYGLYSTPASGVKEGKKLVGKAATIRKPVTVKLWDDHLFGEQGLGIIPIDKDSNVYFGAIDIDDYDVTPQRINQLVQQLELPLVVCRTKSGGSHCYCFVSEACEARTMQNKLREFASALGYGTAEIFPKQTEILAERGDIGQWINMPYFNAEFTTRFALHPATDRAMSVEEFVVYASSKRISPVGLAQFEIKYSEELIGAPPCLQILTSQGFPDGTRNNGLFALGVYAIKAHPDDWEKKIEVYNNQFMSPPLKSTEVQGVIKSLKKKEYEYPCKTEPIHAHCNLTKCRTCKFGVNTGTGLPAMGTLTKLDTDPPLWFIDIVGGGRLELTTDDLQQPLKFQKRCIEVLNVMPVVMKRDQWQLIVQQLLSNVSIISVPQDTSHKGVFFDLLEEFCTGRVQAKTWEDVLVGKPYQIDDKHFFRLKDLMTFLELKKYTEFKRNRITMFLRDMDAQHDFKNISGKGTNLWSIPAFKADRPTLAVPPIEGEGANEAF